jgi:hypothetical protein
LFVFSLRAFLNYRNVQIHRSGKRRVHPGMVGHAFNCKLLGRLRQERQEFKISLDWVGRVAQVVPSKHEALSSNPSTANNNNNFSLSNLVSP